MSDGIPIRLKRAKTYVDKPGIAQRVLFYGEPLYLKDLDALIVGDGTAYYDDDGAVSTVEGSTVEELYNIHDYFIQAAGPTLYQGSHYQYQEYDEESETWVNKDIPADSTDKLLLANIGYVKDYLSKVLADKSMSKKELNANQTLKSIEYKDGVLTVEVQDIKIGLGDLSGFGPEDETSPLMDGEAGVGTSDNWSRSDHRHPTDTTRAAAENPKLTTDTTSASVPMSVDPGTGKGATAATYSQIATTSYVTKAITAAAPTKRPRTSGEIYVIGVEDKDKALEYCTSGSHGGVRINCSTGMLYGAAWNDFAEFRKCQGAPGTVVCETGKGDLQSSGERLQPGASVISDTYGMVIGKDEEGYEPIAVAGRVLALYAGDSRDFKAGMPVCAGPFGRIYPMTREEIKEYPEAIVGYVSEIPDYEEWNGVKVNNRIWIRVK